MTVLEELDEDGVADTELVDCDEEVGLPVELDAVLVLVVVLWLLALADAVLAALDAMTATSPPKAKPDTTTVARRARAAGWRRRGPGRPAAGGRRRAGPDGREGVVGSSGLIVGSSVSVLIPLSMER